MNGIGLPRRQYWVESLIVFSFLLAVVIGLIVRASDAPSDPQATPTISAVVAPVTSLEGLSMHHQEPLFSLDAVVVSGKSFAANSAKQIPVQRSDTLSVSGWGADRIAGLPANAMFVTVGLGKPIALVYGSVRPDVAQALGNPKLVKTGFRGDLPAKLLSSGNVSLKFFVVNAKASSYDEVLSPVSLAVQ